MASIAVLADAAEENGSELRQNRGRLPPKTFISAFVQALAGLGWTDGRNVRMDLRWHGGDTNRIGALAQELVDLQPDIILTGATSATAAVQRETRTLPIVFAGAADPVASGIVAQLDRPSGNITGFATLEASLGGKWLELLSGPVEPGNLETIARPPRPAVRTSAEAVGHRR
jgi:hypothetical protein